MANVIDQVQAARELYQQALRESNQTVSNMFRQTGFQTPGGVPINLESMTGYTPEQARQYLTGLGETTTGEVGDERRLGASQEAEAAASNIQRGISLGGLGRQTRESIEGATQSNVGKIRENLVNTVLGGMIDVSAAGITRNTNINDIYRASGNETADAYAENPYVSNPQQQSSPYVKKGTPGGPNVPKNPRGGKMYTGPGNVTWQYRMNGPQGKGWYRK